MAKTRRLQPGTPKELAKKYQLSDNLYRIQIRPGSRIGGKKLQELNITQAYNLSILEIRRQIVLSRTFP